MPIILSGQSDLIDKLLFHTSRPFASRVVGRSQMEALQRDHMAAYLSHHLSIVGACSPTTQSLPSTKAPAGFCAAQGISPAAPSCPLLTSTAPPSPQKTFVLPSPRFSECRARDTRSQQRYRLLFSSSYCCVPFTPRFSST